MKKQSMLYQICTRLRPGSKQSAILQKAELILDSCERCKFWCSCKKTSLVKTSPQLSCWSRVYSCNFIKSRLHHRSFSAWVICKIALLKIYQNFLSFIWTNLYYSFSKKVANLQPIGCNLRKCGFWQKYRELNFNYK